jgi:3-O-methylgallate 3,4-dioxygenase
MQLDFDITAVKDLVGGQFEGHAYSFIHRRYMSAGVIPIVHVFLNTYYPPNQPSPQRCFDLGTAIRNLVDRYSQDLRVGILASGGLSHFLVNEELDNKVVGALKAKDHDALRSMPAHLLHTGSSEIRNWIVAAAAVPDFDLKWIEYVAAYRSRALTGVGLCFAHWTA